MKKNDQSIILVESSDILYEGLYTLLSRWDKNSRITRTYSVDELGQTIDRNHPHLICINPLLILNKEKEIKRIKREYPQTVICAILSNTIDAKTIAEFDTSFGLYDSMEEIFSGINKAYKEKKQYERNRNNRRNTFGTGNRSALASHPRTYQQRDSRKAQHQRTYRHLTS